MNKRSVWTALAASVLMLSACSGSEGTEAASGDEQPDDDVEIAIESPLGEFLGWDQNADFDSEAAQAEFAEQDRAAQEAIAVCMAEQGFEYVPIDTSAQNAFFESQFEEGLEWGSDEWTAKYGFGISTQRFSQQKVGPDLVGYTWNDFGPGEDQPVDPNQAYVEGLGENEQQAYYDALWGGDNGIDEPIWVIEEREPTDEEIEAYDREWQENYTPSGCENVAYDEIYNGGGEEEFQAFDEAFGDALEQMEQRMDSHPDVIAHRDGVRVCVEEKGLEYLTEEDAWTFFESELDAAGLGWEFQGGDPLADVDTSDFTDEDFQQAYIEFENQPLAPDKLEALAEVQAKEISTAVALNECGGGWQNEMAALQSVRVELEEEFLAANAEELAEFEGIFGN